MWDAESYARFTDEYTRPFLDLLARVPRTDFTSVVDLGCGPGDLTRLLAQRWQAATVRGLDSSPEMLQKARQGPSLPRLHFTEADIATWQPPSPVDLLISNAALQWVPDHATLFPRLAGLLAPRGVLAVQMPDHFAMPVSEAINSVIAQPRWRGTLRGVGLQADTV